MSEHPKLPDGVKLVNSAVHGTFCPEGNWYFVQDLAVPLVWCPNHGWRKYYEANPAEFHFQTFEDAMKAWGEAPNK